MLRKKVISPSQYKALVKPARGDGGDVAALRVSLRMFVGVNVVLKLLEVVTAKLAQRKGKTRLVLEAADLRSKIEAESKTNCVLQSYSVRLLVKSHT